MQLTWITNLQLNLSISCYENQINWSTNKDFIKNINKEHLEKEISIHAILMQSKTKKRGKEKEKF